MKYSFKQFKQEYSRKGNKQGQVVHLLSNISPSVLAHLNIDNRDDYIPKDDVAKAYWNYNNKRLYLIEDTRTGTYRIEGSPADVKEYLNTDGDLQEGQEQAIQNEMRQDQYEMMIRQKQEQDKGPKGSTIRNIIESAIKNKMLQDGNIGRQNYKAAELDLIKAMKKDGYTDKQITSMIRKIKSFNKQQFSTRDVEAHFKDILNTRVNKLYQDKYGLYKHKLWRFRGMNDNGKSFKSVLKLRIKNTMKVLLGKDTAENLSQKESLKILKEILFK